MLILQFFTFIFVLEQQFVAILAGLEPDRCLQPLDSGPCQFYQRRFYYDRAKRQCLPFDYGGCLGNMNRFGTEHECTQECIYQLKYKTKMPEICLMPPNSGECPANSKASGQIWYYFDSESGLCEQFTYYGCAPGNQNRFYSLYQCRSVCGERFDPQIACERCDTRTSECKAVSKYTYVCECRKGYLKTDKGECIDMDECDLMQAECHKNARCVNTIGSYRCECAENYVGDGKRECDYVGTESVAQKCEECDENAVCMSDKCRCKVGFEGNGMNCTDVNECEAKEWPCDSNAECINTQGSFHCECLHGFAGNGHRCSQDSMSCLDKFDATYKEACSGGEWRMHYHLDHSTKQCSMFWYDGCLADSRNIFSQLHTCEEMCVRTNILSKAGRFL